MKEILTFGVRSGIEKFILSSNGFNLSLTIDLHSARGFTASFSKLCNFDWEQLFQLFIESCFISMVDIKLFSKAGYNLGNFGGNLIPEAAEIDSLSFLIFVLWLKSEFCSDSKNECVDD